MSTPKFKVNDSVHPIYDGSRENKLGKIVQVEREKVWDEYKNGNSYFFYKFYYYVKFKDEQEPICYGERYIEKVVN